MKHLKSRVSDLERLFKNNITVMSIAESLVSFDTKTNFQDIIRFMKSRDFDIVGLRKDGLVTNV